MCKEARKDLHGGVTDSDVANGEGEHRKRARRKERHLLCGAEESSLR